MPFDALAKRFKQIEEELNLAIDEQKRQFHFTIREKRVQFEREMRRQHQRLRTSVIRYVVDSSFLAVLFAPIVYSLIIPLALLDLFVTFYQATCFPVYGIAKVKRSDYIVIDRQHLQYLNLIEKLNCAYCGYANGLLAYARAIAGRSEEHWCPIKHARRSKGQHSAYWEFADYGDAENYAVKAQKISERPSDTLRPSETRGEKNDQDHR